MASRKTAQLKKQALVERIEASRDQLSQDIDELISCADLPARIRSRVASNPLMVATSAAVAGLAGAAILRRPVRTARRLSGLRGLITPVAMFGLDLLRRRALKHNPPETTATHPGEQPIPEPLSNRLTKAFWQAIK